MSTPFAATTNVTENSTHDIPGHDMLAKVHTFFIVEEIGKEGFLVRKVYSAPDNQHLLAKNLSPERIKNEVWPEKHGAKPVSPTSTASVAEHVYSSAQHPSAYISASSRFPVGTSRLPGKIVYIDIEKAKAAGAKLVTTEEILKALEDYKTVAPRRVAKINEIAAWVRDIDKEVLIKSEKIPASAIFTPGSFKFTSGAIKGLKVAHVFSIFFTAYDLADASEASVKQESIKPISIEVMKQAGGWGGAMAGARIGATAGALAGIETGPGAILTGAIGGIIFGVAGYYSASWLIDKSD